MTKRKPIIRREIGLLLIGFLVGFFGFLVFPTYLKVVAFFIPLIIVCVVWSSENDYFNMTLFIVLGFVFFLLPTSYFTFDANDPYDFNMMEFASPFIDILSIIVFLFIPAFLVFGIIVGIVSSEMEGAIQALSRLIVVLIFITVGIYLLNWMGVEVFGITRWIFNIYSMAITFAMNIPIYILDAINTVIDWLNFPLKMISNMVNALSKTLGMGDWLTIPTIPNIEMPDEYGYITDTGGKIKRIWTFDMLYARFDTMNQQDRVFAIHNSMPLLMSFFCVLSIIVFARKKWYHKLIKKISKLDVEKPKKERAYYPNMNYKLVVFIVIIIVVAFGLYLSYAQIFKKEEAPMYEMFGVMGFLSIYLFMSIIPLILMNFSGLTYYKDSNLRNTVKGTVFGMMGLFLIFQLMNSHRVMSAMSMEDHSSEALYILNTFIFVAPSESLMFHIFIPALVMGIIVSYSGKKTGQLIEYTNREELIKIESQIMAKEEVIKIYETLQEITRGAGKKALTKDIAKERSKLNSLKQKRTQRISQMSERVFISEDSIYGRPSSLIILIIFGMLIPSFIFASFHFYASGIEDYIVFWTCGLGTLYFAGSVWFIFIGLRYGWLSAVLTHAIHNSLTIILVIIFTAG